MTDPKQLQMLKDMLRRKTITPQELLEILDKIGWIDEDGTIRRGHLTKKAG